MDVRGKDIIDKFIREHRDAKRPVKAWLVKAEAAKWEKVPDIEATFTSAHRIQGTSNSYVFHIGGSSYRLEALVTLFCGTVIIRKIVDDTGKSDDSKTSEKGE